MRAKRRTFRAYLVEPFKQIRFGLHVVFVSLLFSALFAYVFLWAFLQQYQQVFEWFSVIEAESKAAMLDNEVFIRNGYILAATILAFVITTLYVVVRRTHRMYGPMISMMRFVAELKKGNYAVRIHIRERDDFHNFVAELNALAETLQARHGVPAISNGEQGMDGLDKRLDSIEDGVVIIGDSKVGEDMTEESPKAS
jgi:signal transduction histidine kinase